MTDTSSSILDIRLKDRLYIGGDWIRPMGERRHTIVRPSDGSALGDVTLASLADAGIALDIARRCADESKWSGIPVEKRAAILDRVANELESRANALCEALGQELGQHPDIAAARVRDAVLQWRRSASLLRQPEALHFGPAEDGRHASVRREPVGVVLAITPWNSPLLIACMKIAPALAAGCPVVVKPAVETPLTFPILADSLQQAGVPHEAVSILPAGPAVSAAMTSDDRVDMVTFTGSTSVGSKIMSACAPRVARVALELGGKSPAIVLPSTSPESFASQVLAATCIGSASQVCVSRTRIFVSKRDEERWVDALVDQMRSIPTSGPTAMSPLATVDQLDRVERYVAAGIAGGAFLATGGHKRQGSGYYYEPTLFTQVTDDMSIAREEIFGPVICLQTYDSLDEAVSRANATKYGLAASVFGDNLVMAEKLASRLRAGTIHINTFGSAYDLPSGGYKSSGIGREGGREGLNEFLETKQIVYGSF